MPPDTDPDPAPRLKRSYDDALAGSLFMGRTDRLDELFYAQRARPPLVIWDPNRIDLQDTEFVSFIDELSRLPAVRGLPLASAFDASKIVQSDWFMHLEVLNFGNDFRYLKYGTGVAEYYGRSLEGRLTSEIGGHISRFFIALYRASMHRRQCALSEHEPPTNVFVRIWRRLIMPLADETGFVTHFAVLNLPENHLRAGLDVVPFPCLIVDKDRLVCFANSGARQLAGLDRTWEHGGPLEALIGCNLDLPPDPESLISPNNAPIRRMVSLDLPGQHDRTCEIHIAAARYRSRAVFVITVLPRPE